MEVFCNVFCVVGVVEDSVLAMEYCSMSYVGDVMDVVLSV